jgi:hypothetical protein
VVASYRTRSAIRDVGKALGVPEALVDAFAKDHFWFDERELRVGKMGELAAHLGVEVPAKTLALWMELSEELMGFPRHLSQHVGGFVLTQGKLTRLVPVENAAMPDRSVIQWDKDDLDEMGLLKVDVLALGMLTAIRRCLDFVGQRRGHPFALTDIPDKDPATYDMICRADTVGVFQIESRAQMSMLPRLKPEKFYDLVIEVAIVRPGPIQGGMIHPYLKARERLREGGAGPIRKRGAAAGAGAHAGHPDLPGAGDADLDDRRRLLRRRGRPAAPLHGRLEAQRRRAQVPGPPDPGHAEERLPPGSSPRASSSRSWASANTASPKAMPTASPCWPTTAAGSSATNPRPSSPPCSTRSPWASMRRRS